MGAGASGEFFLFFLSSIGQFLLSSLVLAYAGYSFLVTLVNTAAGNDEVIWPGDPIQDWLFKGLYLLWIMAILTIPATSLASQVGLTMDMPQYHFLVLAIVWFFFPICLLSSLSGSSRLLIFRLTILWRMARNPFKVLAFYVASAGLLIGCIWLVYLAEARQMELLPVASVVGAVGFLIYARLLGRLAWIMSRGISTEEEEEPEEGPAEKKPRTEVSDPWGGPERISPSEEPDVEPPPVPKAPPLPKNAMQSHRSTTHDPWAALYKEIDEKRMASGRKPQPSEPGEGAERGVYKIVEEDSNWQKLAPRKGRRREIGDEVFALAPPDGKELPRQLPELPEPMPVTRPPSRLERAMAAPRVEQPEPGWPLVTGVYTFPLYRPCFAPLLTLALGFLAIMALLRVQIQLLAELTKDK